MTNLDSIFKSRDITSLTKLCLVKTMVFPVVMYGCVSWTIKKAEPLKNWYFWTVVCWRRLSSPLDCKVVKPVNPKGNQSCIFIRKTDAETEAPIFNHWYEEPTHWKRPWCWARFKAGEGDDRGRDGWREVLIQWTWVWPSSRNLWWSGKPDMLQSMGLQRVGHNWMTELSWSIILVPGSEEALNKRKQFFLGGSTKLLSLERTSSPSLSPPSSLWGISVVIGCWGLASICREIYFFLKGLWGGGERHLLVI